MEPIEANKGRVDIETDNNEYLLELKSSRVEDGAEYVKTDKGMRFVLNEPEELSNVQRQYLSKFLNDAEKSISGLNYINYSNFIDIDSFIDFYIAEEFSKNVDVAFSSTRFYIKDNKLYAGPVWDFDLSSGNAAENLDEKYSSYK